MARPSKSVRPGSGSWSTSGTLAHHVAETLRIGVPLAAAQLAQMAMSVTDTIFLGRIGPEALAAGGLGTSLTFTILIVLQGVVGAVSVFVAQARGGGREREVPALFWSAALLAGVLCLPAMALLSVTEPLLLALGEPAPIAHDAGVFVDTLRWCVPGSMFGMGLLRAFLPAIDAGWLILPAMLVAIVVNAVVGYGLIHGAWGLPSLGMRGPAVATVIVSSLVAAGLGAATFAAPGRRGLVRWARPRLAVQGALLRLGIPIGATFAVEAGLFVAVALLIGRLGPVALASHQVAFTTVGLAFMIPLGLGQAANVRVAHRVGAGDRVGARRAGIVAIWLGAGSEFIGALISWFAPETLTGFYLDHDNAEAFAAAVALLSIAAVFQVADGIQAVAAGALRGLGDARVPFLLAAAGYWGIGFPLAWGLAGGLGGGLGGLGAAGAWWGLAAGLGVTASLLTGRFLRRTRAGSRLFAAD